MLTRAKEITGKDVVAVDGPVGEVDDVIFEPIVWTVQKIVVRLGGLLRRERLSVPRSAIEGPDGGRLAVSLWRGDLHRAALDDDTRRSLDGESPADTKVVRIPRRSASEESALLSANEVIGYRLRAAGGDVGRVRDLVLDPATWMILGVVTSTRVWLPSRKVLVPVPWLEGVDHDNRRVYTRLTVRTLRCAPRFDPPESMTPDAIKTLFPYFSSPPPEP